MNWCGHDFSWAVCYFLLLFFSARLCNYFACLQPTIFMYSSPPPWTPMTGAEGSQQWSMDTLLYVVLVFVFFSNRHISWYGCLIAMTKKAQSADRHHHDYLLIPRAPALGILTELHARERLRTKTLPQVLRAFWICGHHGHWSARVGWGGVRHAHTLTHARTHTFTHAHIYTHTNTLT